MPSQPTPPNILVLHTDAHCHHHLGCAGNPDIRTPNIDALAASGTYFRNAYACSAVCGPSRACLMTGRYPIAHGRINNFGSLPATEETMGSLFAKAGYRNGYFGKTHYGRQNNQMEAEGWERTFLVDDYNAYLKAQGLAFEYPRNLVAKSRTRYWKMGTGKIPMEHYFEPVLGAQAADFMTKVDKQPFLCVLSMMAPHGPFCPPPPYDDAYDPAALTLFPRGAHELAKKPKGFVRWVEQNRKYLDEEEQRTFLAITYGMIQMVDDVVGRVVQQLKDSGQYDNTLIVFASDHGDYATKYGILGKSWCLDDVLVRIPFIISHPAHQTTSRASDALVENVDILPTLLECAGAAVPELTQGQSLLPILDGRREQVKDAAYCFHSSEDGGGRLALSMVRTGQWKLVQADTGEDQLFDLDDDPYEWDNRIDDPACREVRDTLRLQLLRWHIAHSGQFYRPEYARYWADETLFYDETRFNGERQFTRSGEWHSTTS